MQPHEALFLSLMVTNCSGKRSFSIFKRIKNVLKGRNIPGEVVHTKNSVHWKWQTWPNKLWWFVR